MVVQTADRLRAVMGCADRVRNVSVIAHVDHGKTTLTDQLLCAAGELAQQHAGDKCAMDTRKDEQLRGITIKSTAISLYHELTADEMTLLPKPKQAGLGVGGEERGDGCGEGRGFLINLIDSPGHVDFSSEVTAALRLTDGAMVVVDCVSGVCVQTETVLRQAITERVRPVLMMNKLDRCILEKQMDPEDLYLHLAAVISRVNGLITTYHDESTGIPVPTLDPVAGNVCMGSGLHGWGFTLRDMALFYARRLGVDAPRLLRRLWGDHFYNPTDRKWRKTPGEGYIRGFNKFVLEPLYRVLKTTLGDGLATELEELLTRIDVTLAKHQAELVGKKRMRAVMQKWLPAGVAMLRMLVAHLPSPQVAQGYRAELLYEGPADDAAAIGIKTCDPAAPLMVYISKMVPSEDGSGRFYAFGRVFSGTASSGQKVRVLGPNYSPKDNTRDVQEITIARTVIMMGGHVLSVDDVPAGSVVGLSGIDKVLRKTATITTFAQAHNMAVLRFSVSPVVRMAVEPSQRAADLGKLVEGLHRLSKSDPLVEVTMEESGQLVLAGAGELHLEVAFNDLEGFLGVKVKRSQPIVSFRETVTGTSPKDCLTKTTNKLNRLHLAASALSTHVCADIDDGKIKPTDNTKDRARHLVDEHGWDVTDARRIWCFGPETRGPNFLCNVTKGVQHLADIRDSVVAGFQWATKEGPLCEERMRGVRLDITDAKVHAMNECRRAAQVIPASRRGFLGTILSAQPRLLEPVYLVEIHCHPEALGGVYQTLSLRRGHIFEETEDTPLFTLKAHLPVCESFGFTGSLRGATSGQAFPQCVFSHWQVMPGDPLDPSSRAGSVVAETRTRKGLPEEIMGPEFYLQKM